MTPPRTRARPADAIRRLRSGRTGLTALGAVRESLVSVAGLVGRPVLNGAGAEVGRIVDIVVRWTGDDDYPPVTALVVRVGRRTAFVSGTQIEAIRPGAVVLSSARVALEDFQRRPGEVPLCSDVLDHQLVDVDGVQVIRASDLYLAPIGGGHRLVGAETGLGALWRRLGPATWRRRVTPHKVLDWAAIEPFGAPQQQVRLRSARQELRRLRPADVADLLEDLDGSARQELLESLDPSAAADALEEMDPEELEALLREQRPERAAALLAGMEPDEAADALRDLSHDERRRLLALMPAEAARAARVVLGHDEDTAGGIMTPNLVTVTPRDTVADARAALQARVEHADVLDAVIVVDPDGRVVDDLDLFALLVADPDAGIATLLRDESPLVVRTDTDLREVANLFVDARRSSLVVVDAHDRPAGRILADDIVDALLPERGRVHFPRLFE